MSRSQSLAIDVIKPSYTKENVGQKMSSVRPTPYFICLGPERTGTTWLYSNLSAHPEIYLPPVKEIRYFNEAQDYPNESWRQRLAKDGDWHTQSYRKYLRKRWRFYARRPVNIITRMDRFRWDVRHLFSHRNDAWYRSVFAAAGRRRAGDISPQYFFSLKEASIADIRRQHPNVKLLLFLRNPIEWCWSFTRMAFVRQRPIEDIPESELIEFCERRLQVGSFSETLERWQRYFPPEQLFIGFHDSLLESPHKLFSEICDFLEIDPGAVPADVFENLKTPVNRGKRHTLSDALAQYLATVWQPDIERLCELADPHPRKWREQCEEILRR